MADPTPPVPPAGTAKPKSSPLAGLVIPLLLILAAGVVFTVFYLLNQNIPAVNAAALFDRYAAAAEKASKLSDEYKDANGDEVADTPADAKEPAELFFTEIPGPNPDADEATWAAFLDHMSKVYRYLLRNNEEKLVTLETEIGFIRSYYYLLRARYGEALQLRMDIPEPAKELMIPPLTLQMIIENILNQNAISRSQPLVITLQCADNRIDIGNTLQPKINGTDDSKQVIENISNKFRLLCQREPVIWYNEKQCVIQIPLISNKELAAI